VDMIPDAVIIKEGDEGDSMFFISRSIGYGRSVHWLCGWAHRVARARVG
jgi:hypothetical protein